MTPHYKAETRAKDIIADIIAARKEAGTLRDSYSETFTYLFCRSLPRDDLTGATSHANWADTAAEAERFVREPKTTPYRVTVTPPRKNAEDGSEYSVVEIISDDKPFLIDSITEELNKYNIDTYTISHPVFDARRDKNGNLLEIYPPSHDDSVSAQHLESYQYYHITPLRDEEARERLKAEISDILDTVSLVVTDWPAIVARLRDVKTRFTACADIYRDNVPQPERAAFDEASAETEAFLTWLKDGNFVFLGYAGEKEKDNAEGGALGVMRPGAKDPGVARSREHAPGASAFPEGRSAVIDIAKTDKRSLVHRPVHMDCITVRLFDEKGVITEEHRFIGMFTSVVYYQSATLIPLIRLKINQVVRRSRFLRNSHDGKALHTVLEAFPRDELFQIRADQLFDVAMGIVGLSVRPRVRLFLRQDELSRYFSCIVFIPRDRMSTTLRYKIEKILSDALNGTVSNHYTQISESPLARLQIIIKTAKGEIPDYDESAIEEEIARVTHDWEDNLRAAVTAHTGEENGRALARKYNRAFPEDYRGRFSPENAYNDITRIESLLAGEKDVIFSLERGDYRNNNVLELKVYRLKEQIPLSEMLPIVEHLGVKTIDEFTYAAHSKLMGETAWIHVLRLEDAHTDAVPFEELRRNIEEMLEHIRHEHISDDALNALAMQAGLHWRQIVLLRAYTEYLKQARFRYSRAFVQQTAVKYPQIMLTLLHVFDARFNPDHKEKERAERCAHLKEKLEKLLSHVSDNAEDRVIRAFSELCFATKRTNFYQLCAKGKPKEYISFKLFSREIGFLPKPRPFAEIYVYSARVEGIHLRGGKVARGGLRWSDRFEDFRTEVLGLMKAQMTKNSVIIPVGSKGGFIVKKPKADRDANFAEGKECYRTFLRGLLDITDNLQDGKVIAPARVTRHDGDDPYLVVAADKGTATFSDIANGISEEYGFWLGDAFASGGTVGYDHKKMGITARGAWISVQRHFRETGIDVQTEPVTVIGIGDMSGDVFGNGMLLSESLKLVAAFNHLHIFVDPDPDPALSFKERERLFALERSSWTDYNAKLISEGGGVFERSAKSLALSPQMRELVQTYKTDMAPDEFIRELLAAPVDLLWNGGIGTYVKSRYESHEDVGDRANDAVRRNGAELRVKVIGEGGNLGFTQLGRIEYALNGGRINTDAIDNSAGVDCSDHEVNIKILLGRAVADGKLTQQNRDALLESMTGEVAELVLNDNVMQTQTLTIAELQAPYQLEALSRFIDYLEQRYTLEREVEFLPSKDEITRRQFEGKGLTRPELAVVLAYAKLYLYESLLSGDLPDNAYHTEDLLRYFPDALASEYTDYALNHPLKREIIATVITNSLINRVGSSGYFRLTESTGAASGEIAHAYVILRDVFDLRTIWQEVEELAGRVSAETKAMLFNETQRLILRASPWLIRVYEKSKDIASIVATYKDDVAELAGMLPEILPAQGQTQYYKRLEDYIERGVPRDTALRIAALHSLLPALDIIYAKNNADYPLKDVASIYYALGERLALRRIREYLQKDNTGSYWRQLSALGLSEELYQEQGRIAECAIAYFCNDKSCTVASLPEWEKAHAEQLSRYDAFLEEMKAHEEEANVSLVVILLRKLKEIG